MEKEADKSRPRLRGPADPRFSTDCWREFPAGYPRPARFIPVAAAYLVLAGFLSRGFREHGTDAYICLAAACSLLLTIIAALAGARRAASRAGRQKLREKLDRLPADRRAESGGRWLYRELAAVLAGPGLALALLLPLYLVCAWGLFGGITAAYMKLGYGALLWLEAGASMVMAAAVGLWAGAAKGARKAPRAALVALAVGVLARGLIAGTVGLAVSNAENDGRLGAMWGAGFDAALSLGFAFAVMQLAWRMLCERLERPERGAPSEAEMLIDSPQSLGLGVSCWSLFRWRLFRDPLFRAERRSYWTRRRLVALWLVVIVLSMSIPLSFSGALQVEWLITAIWGHVSIVAGVVWYLPCWIAPALTATALAGGRQRGTLEGLRVTPAAPLRLLGAKLAGRCSHLVLAMLIAELAGDISWYLLPGLSMESSIPRTIVYSAVNALSETAHVLVFGAAGLYFAARFRALAAALVSAYAFALAYTFTVQLAREPVTGYLGLGPGSHDLEFWVTAWLLEMTLHGWALCWLMRGAARRLALPRGE